MEADNKAQQEFEEIERQVAQIKKLHGQQQRSSPATRATQGAAFYSSGRDECTANRLAKNGTRPSSPAPANPRLHRAPVHRLQRNSRRSHVRRRCRHYLRNGPLPRRRSSSRWHAKRPRRDNLVHRNFGTPHPEGYRKALRIMQVAEKSRRPILLGECGTPAFMPKSAAKPRPSPTTCSRDGAPRSAHHCNCDWRRRQRRSTRDRRGRSRPHDGKLNLFGHLSRRLRRHHVARRYKKKELAAEAMRITATDLSELGCI